MVGWIKYDDKIIKVNVLEDRPSYKVVETEQNELLCIPVESGVHIWNTEQECREREERTLYWGYQGRY